MKNNRSFLTARRAAVVAAIAAAGTVSAWRIAAHAADTAHDGGHDAAPEPSVAVQTVRIERETISQPVQAYGIVSSTSPNTLTIDLPYTARVMQLRVQPGQTVKRGAPLAVVQADAAAALAADQAKSAATLAHGELARTQSMFDEGLATQSQLAAAKKNLQDARGALAAQERMGVTAGSRTIVAPMDGVVLLVAVSQGDQVQPGAALMQLAAAARGTDARPNVQLGLEPADAAAIHPGDVVTLHGLSTALDQTAVTGHVTMVGAAVDAQSQLVNMAASVPLPSQSPFIPGTRVRAEIATDTGNHWVVPRSAVLRDDKGAYVFQVTSDDRARRVPVDVKIDADDRYGVDGALNSAMPIVVVGNYELQDGMAVRVAGGAAR